MRMQDRPFVCKRFLLHYFFFKKKKKNAIRKFLAITEILRSEKVNDWHTFFSTEMISVIDARS